jgi:hypothetical protein
MTRMQLEDEIEVELDRMARTVQEVNELLRDASGRKLTTRELAAAGAFLGNFYGGTESIMKRVCRFEGLPLPDGANLHADLFALFSSPERSRLPELIGNEFRRPFILLRKLRHVVFRGYPFDLDDDRIRPGLLALPAMLDHLRQRVRVYLANLA